MDSELNNTEFLLRCVLIVTGLWVAGHHFAAATAFKRAPKFAKIVLMPLTVGSGIGMVWAAVYFGSGVALLFSLPALVCICIRDKMIWSSGEHISAAFDRMAAAECGEDVRL